MRFVAITPGDGRDLVPWLGAIAPWADAVILREPHATASDMLRWVDVVRRSGALAIRHLRAPDVPADAVHLYDGAPFPAAIRFGASRHDAAGVAEALAGGAEYVLLSPVFDPTSKPATAPALGIQRFVDMAVDERVLALGGVTPGRARTLAAHGRGVAVLGCLMGARTPADAGRLAYHFHRAVRSCALQ